MEPVALGARKGKVMAKGQKRSNTDVTKPKQATPKAPPAHTFAGKLGEAQDRGKGSKT